MAGVNCCKWRNFCFSSDRNWTGPSILSDPPVETRPDVRIRTARPVRRTPHRPDQPQEIRRCKRCPDGDEITHRRPGPLADDQYQPPSPAMPRAGCRRRGSSEPGSRGQRRGDRSRGARGKSRSERSGRGTDPPSCPLLVTNAVDGTSKHSPSRSCPPLQTTRTAGDRSTLRSRPLIGLKSTSGRSQQPSNAANPGATELPMSQKKCRRCPVIPSSCA
jgi:hypothetical protein